MLAIIIVETTDCDYCGNDVLITKWAINNPSKNHLITRVINFPYEIRRGKFLFYRKDAVTSFSRYLFMVLNASRDRIVVYEIYNWLNIKKFVLTKIREFADYELEGIYDNINDFDVVLIDDVLHFIVIFQASNKIKLFSWSPDLPGDINGSALLDVNEKFTAPTMNLNEIKCLESVSPPNPIQEKLTIGCVFITGRNRLYEFFYNSYNNRSYEIDQNLQYYIYYEYKNYDAKSVRLSQTTIFLSSVAMNPVVGSHRPARDPEELVVTYTRENRVINN